MCTSASSTVMLVSEGRPGEVLRIDLVDAAGEKQEAKKRFRRFAFPREVDSDNYN